jgi:hypothetical protein
MEPHVARITGRSPGRAPSADSPCRNQMTGLYAGSTAYPRPLPSRSEHRACCARSWCSVFPKTLPWRAVPAGPVSARQWRGPQTCGVWLKGASPFKTITNDAGWQNERSTVDGRAHGHGELINLPPDEQAEMMKSLAAVSAEVAKRKPGLEQAFNVFAAVAKRTQQ